MTFMSLVWVHGFKTFGVCSFQSKKFFVASMIALKVKFDWNDDNCVGIEKSVNYGLEILAFLSLESPTISSLIYCKSVRKSKFHLLFLYRAAGRRELRSGWRFSFINSQQNLPYFIQFFLRSHFRLYTNYFVMFLILFDRQKFLKADIDMWIWHVTLHVPNYIV